MTKIEMHTTFKSGKETWTRYAFRDFRDFHEMVETIVDMLFDINDDLDYVAFYENGEIYRKWYMGEEIFDEIDEEY